MLTAANVEIARKLQYAKPIGVWTRCMHVYAYWDVTRWRVVYKVVYLCQCQAHTDFSTKLTIRSNIQAT